MSRRSAGSVTLATRSFGPALIGGEVAVALGQEAVGDEQLPQVLASVGHGRESRPSWLSGISPVARRGCVRWCPL